MEFAVSGEKFFLNLDPVWPTREADWNAAGEEIAAADELETASRGDGGFLIVTDSENDGTEVSAVEKPDVSDAESTEEETA